MIIRYITVTGTIEIEVDDKWGELIKKEDAREKVMERNIRRHSLRMDTQLDGSSWIKTEKGDPYLSIGEPTAYDVLAVLAEFMDTLTDEQKTLFVSRVIDKKTQAEIAKERGVSQQAISKQYLRIIRKLKKYLLKLGCIMLFF